MALPNPIYIGAAGAMHKPEQIRLLSYGLTTGVEGVLGNDDCAVRALGTPGAAIQVMPGAYNVLAKHLGGDYESYAGSFDVAETVSVSPTSSAGSRRDLVVLVIMDTSVSGSGSWPAPPSQEDGPYAEIRVIENVGSTVWDVRQVEPTWSAITLARIDRDPSTGVVVQDDIINLRSIAALGGTRTIVIENPPVTVPPIAQQVYATSVKCTANDTLRDDQTNWVDFPQQANWQVPVPEWARTVSVMATATPSSQTHVWAEFRLNINGAGLGIREVDINRAGDTLAHVYRGVIPYGGVYEVPSGARGRVVTVKMQARSAYSGSGGVILKADGMDSDGRAGCYVDLWLLFQRHPNY